MYAYQTEQGQAAIRQRDATAQFYACLTDLDVSIDPNPLAPIAVSFRNGNRVQEVAIVRNRSERMSEFSWPTILITTSKVEQLIARARALRAVGRVLVCMADNVLLLWTVVDVNGVEQRYESQITTTKGDCMGSHQASRQNMFLPIEKAVRLESSLLI